MEISFRNLENDINDFIQLHTWCQNEFVYRWFEQRRLSLTEITNKYKNKLKENKQKILIIKCNNKDIGLVQFYKFENDINLKELSHYNNIYEYDLFIGEIDYLGKGIGSEVINLINKMIYSKYNADAIILRPFKSNIRAINCYKKNNFRIVTEYQGTDTIGNEETIVVLINS